MARGIAIAAVTAGVAAIGVFAAMPGSREWLGTRGGFLAWTATAGFLGTIVAVVTLVARTPSLPRSYLAVAAVAGVGALDAGYSGLAYSPPKLLGVPMEGGSSLLELAHVIGLTPLVVAAVVLPVGVGVWLSHRRGTLRSVTLALVEQRPLLFAILATLGITGAWVTGAATSGPVGGFAADLLMYSAAALTLVASGRMAVQRRTVVQWRRRIRPWISDESSRIGGPGRQRGDRAA